MELLSSLLAKEFLSPARLWSAVSLTITDGGGFCSDKLRPTSSLNPDGKDNPIGDRLAGRDVDRSAMLASSTRLYIFTQVDFYRFLHLPQALPSHPSISSFTFLLTFSLLPLHSFFSLIFSSPPCSLLAQTLQVDALNSKSHPYGNTSLQAIRYDIRKSEHHNRMETKMVTIVHNIYSIIHQSSFNFV